MSRCCSEPSSAPDRYLDYSALTMEYVIGTRKRKAERSDSIRSMGFRKDLESGTSDGLCRCGTSLSSTVRSRSPAYTTFSLGFTLQSLDFQAIKRFMPLHPKFIANSSLASNMSYCGNRRMDLTVRAASFSFSDALGGSGQEGV